MRWVADAAVSSAEEDEEVSDEVCELNCAGLGVGVDILGREAAVGHGEGRARLWAVGVVGEGDWNWKWDGRTVRNEAGELDRVVSAWFPKTYLNSGFATSSGVNLRDIEKIE